MTIPRFRPRSISSTVEKLTKPIFSKRGFGRSTIIENWRTIVGKEYGDHTIPEKISYPQGQQNKGTIQIRVDSPALAIELLHAETQILERINSHFGYRSVDHVKITQGTIPDNKDQSVAKPREITIKEQNNLENNLNIISDPDLKNALRTLGKRIKTSK